MRERKLGVIVILFICLIGSGCSFSTSSKNSSKSSSSPSRSSSGASGEKSVQRATDSYQEDIEALAILYVGSSGSSQSFLREMNQISAKHGLIDWQNNPTAFKAIGRGLKRAGVQEDGIADLVFLDDLRDSRYYFQILAGFK